MWDLALSYLVVAGTVCSAAVAVYAFLKTAVNFAKAYRNWRQDGTWEFMEATRQRKDQLRELRRIRQQMPRKDNHD